VAGLFEKIDDAAVAHELEELQRRAAEAGSGG
jgi:hypothetical protein